VITENLDAFLADFGEAATLDGTAVRVIFDAPHAALPGEGAGMSDSLPSALIKSSSVPSTLLDDTADPLLVLTEAATLRPGFPSRYRVTEIQPDGTGFTTLLLREAPAA
jgi:hypothetical protein